MSLEEREGDTMKAKKALTPAMERALASPRNRNPKIFAPDQYELYVPSWTGEYRPYVSQGNSTPRWVGVGLYSHTPEQSEESSRFAGRVDEDQVERLVDLHDQYED
jgi:hypothetical protein